MKEVDDLQQRYCSTTKEMEDFARNFLKQNGDKISLDIEEYEAFDEDPVVLTMLDRHGNSMNVTISSLEICGTTMYVMDEDSNLFEVYPEHMFWILEFISKWEDYNKLK